MRPDLLYFCAICCLIVDRVANYLYSQNSIDLRDESANKSAKRLTKRDAPTKYISGRRLCNFDRITYCNEHFQPHRCICYVPSQMINAAAKMDVPYCSEILRVDSLEYLIITIGIGFPIPEQFTTDSDSIFTEDLEFFANIHRNSTFIMRKGCLPNKSVYEFQFGVTKTYRNPKAGKRFLTQHDLENIYPSMFTAKLNFMQQNGLIIEYVQQSDTFRPIIGYSEWVRDQNVTLVKSSLGQCNATTKNPQYDCFFYEFGAVFFAVIYIGAAIVTSLTFGLVKIVYKLRGDRNNPTHSICRERRPNAIVV